MLTSCAAALEKVALDEGVAADVRPIFVRPTIDALVAKHEALVKRLACQLISHLPPSIEIGDLIQIGMIGLLEAADRYRDSTDCSFATFATYRIRGAMVDALRKYQLMPRTTIRDLRKIDAAKSEIGGPNGGKSTAARVAHALNIPVSSYHRTMLNIHTATALSLEAIRGGDGEAAIPEPVDAAPRPDELLEREQLLRVLADAIDALPASERAILLLYYDEEYLLREIGAALDLTESRVCQIQKKTLHKLRERVLRYTGSLGAAGRNHDAQSAVRA